MSASQFLYRLQPTRTGMLTGGPTQDEERIVGQHFAYLQKLLADGRLLMAGRTTTEDERVFGIVIFTAVSASAALEVMQNDPAVRQGVMSAELFPYRVALWGKP